MGKVLEFSQIKQERKHSRAQLERMEWEDQKVMLLETLNKFPIATAEIWEQDSGIPADLFREWKYRFDMEQYGRPRNTEIQQ